MSMDRIVEKIVERITKTEKETFSKNEIVNLIKDTTIEKKIPILESNGIIINCEKFLVKINDVEYHFPKKMFNLLYYFILNKNKSLSRGELLNYVWGDGVIVIERTVDVHVGKLRSLLPEDYIKTSFGVGYTWIEK